MNEMGGVGTFIPYKAKVLL